MNCQSDVSGKYCHNCGQKTDTHRITFKHFITHDLLHGVWHIEKGLFFTLKEIIVRPGQTAVNYIAGQRIRYYNFFYLSLILIALNILTTTLNGVLNPENTVIISGDGGKIYDFVRHFIKLLLFGIIPLNALASFIVFKKLKSNYTEHLIIGGVSLLGILFLTLAFNCFHLLTSTFGLFNAFDAVYEFILVVIFLYPLWVSFDLSKLLFKGWALVLLAFANYLLFLFLLLLSFFAILIALFGSSFEGQVTIPI